jgi:BolA protein
MVSVKQRIEEKLTAAFQPESLRVVDESHLHAGHAGARPGGETHFRVSVASKAFAGRSRVERHRMVNSALAEELAGPVHALAIDASAPSEG